MAVRDEGQHEAVDEPFLPHDHLAHFVLDLLHQLALRGDAVCRVLQIHVVHSPFEILVELYAETVRRALDATRKNGTAPGGPQLVATAAFPSLSLLAGLLEDGKHFLLRLPLRLSLLFEAHAKFPCKHVV